MGVELHVTGRIQTGRFAEFLEAAERWRAYRGERSWAVPRVLSGLSGEMNSVRLIFAYPDLDVYEREDTPQECFRAAGGDTGTAVRNARRAGSGREKLTGHVTLRGCHCPGPRSVAAVRARQPCASSFKRIGVRHYRRGSRSRSSAAPRRPSASSRAQAHTRQAARRSRLRQ